MPSPVRMMRGGKVLLADEDRNELARLGQMLEGEGHQVRRCASYAEAIEEMEEHSYDVVVVGQGTSGGEGGAVVEKARGRKPPLPVLVLERAAGVGFDREAGGQGGVEFLRKPTSPADSMELKEAVARHVKPRMLVLSPDKI
jgi:DNA-binding NtrC family response regulator